MTIIDTNIEAKVTVAARAKFAVGTDIQVSFDGPKDNSAFNVEVFGIKDVETGAIYGLRLMAYAGKDEWRMNSASKALADVWTYRDDLRVVAGFQGKVLIGASGGKTYAVFIKTGKRSQVEHVVPLLDLLRGSSTSFTAAESGRLKTALAKTFAVEAMLSKEEDEAINFRETEVCRKDGLRLMKYASVLGGSGIYRVRNMAGEVVGGFMQTQAEGYLAIGHVPEAPKVPAGGKTNVGGKYWEKGPRGQSGGGKPAKSKNK